MSSLEVLVVLEVVAAEVGLGRSTGSAQAVVVLQLLDVIQADADTLVAVGVEGEEVNGGAAPAAGVDLVGIQDLVQILVHDARASGCCCS